MTGYEGSHKDWLEDQASDQLEREAYERSKFDDRTVIQGDGWEIIHTTVPQRLADFSFIEVPAVRIEIDRQFRTMSHREAVNLANAILTEVEIAQRGGDDE